MTVISENRIARVRKSIYPRYSASGGDKESGNDRQTSGNAQDRFFLKNVLTHHKSDSLSNHSLSLPDGKTKSCTANTTDNVHKVSYIILYKEDTVYLLA